MGLQGPVAHGCEGLQGSVAHGCEGLQGSVAHGRQPGSATLSMCLVNTPRASLNLTQNLLLS